MAKVRNFKHLWLVSAACAMCMLPAAGQQSVADSLRLPGRLKPEITWVNMKVNKNTFVTAFPFCDKGIKHQPFFCRIESTIEKRSKIALRMRLGDLNYVNMLENKN